MLYDISLRIGSYATLFSTLPIFSFAVLGQISFALR